MDLRSLRSVLEGRHGHVSALLDALDPDRAVVLAQAGHVGRWSRGEQILAEGAPTSTIAFLLDGALGMIKQLPDHPTHVVGLLVPGDMFGRLGDTPMAYRVEALSDASALVFDRRDFETAVQSSLAAERLLLVAMLDELDAARDWLVVMGTHGAVERLSGFLLLLLRRRAVFRSSTGEAPLQVELPVRRVDLAHHLGVRPESLSRAFRRLQVEGLITTRSARRVVIENLPALVDRSGQDISIPDGKDVSTPDDVFTWYGLDRRR